MKMKSSTSWIGWLAPLGLSLLLLGCAIEREEDTLKKDEEEISAYLQVNNLQATRHPSGVYFQLDTLAGSGARAILTDTVAFYYKGSLLDRFVFDQLQTGDPARFAVSRLIPGLQVAFSLLRKGDRGTFYIPSALGFGSIEREGIPANSPLIFEVQCLNIIKPK